MERKSKISQEKSQALTPLIKTTCVSDRIKEELITQSPRVHQRNSVRHIDKKLKHPTLYQNYHTLNLSNPKIKFQGVKTRIQVVTATVKHLAILQASCIPMSPRNTYNIGMDGFHASLRAGS